MDKNITPEDTEQDEELNNLNREEASEGEIQKHGRRRKRIKVRRRIRIKKRTNPKKKVKKTMETIAWLILITLFLTVLIWLISTLDIKDKDTKKRYGKEVSLLENEFTVYRLQLTVPQYEQS